jgi:hypothetical protein
MVLRFLNVFKRRYYDWSWESRIIAKTNEIWDFFIGKLRKNKSWWLHKKNEIRIKKNLLFDWYFRRISDEKSIYGTI